MGRTPHPRPSGRQYPVGVEIDTAYTTYHAAMGRPGRQRAPISDIDLPEKLLAPDERVHDVCIGSERRGYFPVLIATDRRILLAGR